MTEGDSIKIKLTDGNGTPIASQTVNVTITDKDKASDYHSVVTNEKGMGTLKLDEDAGKYTVTISYGGNDKYKSSNATKKIIIKEEVVETQTTSSQSSSSSNNDNSINYDSELNVYYDSNGVIVDPDGKHPQGVGNSYNDLVEQAESGRGML